MVPPGGVDAMIRIGLLGKACAIADALMQTPAISARAIEARASTSLHLSLHVII